VTVKLRRRDTRGSTEVRRLPLGWRREVDDGRVSVANAHPCLMLCHLPITSSSDSLSLSDVLEESQGPTVGPPKGRVGNRREEPQAERGKLRFFCSACGKTLQRASFSGASRGEPFCPPVWRVSSLRTRSGAVASPAKRTQN
jgi:hypothetical protein